MKIQMKRIPWFGLKLLLIAACSLMSRAVLAADAVGSVAFNNHIVGVVEAKVARPDGTGAGMGAKAQLLLVATDGSLTALTPATTFRTESALAAYYVNPVTVNVTGRIPGQQAVLRMRAWIGASFDAATLRGESKDVTIALGGGTLPPANLTGLQGFALAAPTTGTTTTTGSTGGTAPPASGVVNFNNHVIGAVEAPVTRPDGTGAGAGVKGQLFLVGTGGKLSELSPVTSFRTESPEAAFYVNPVNVTVSGSAPGSQVTMRMRAWSGSSYDASTLRGESKDFVAILGGGTLPPSNLSGLQSFALAAPTGSSTPATTFAVTIVAGDNGSVTPNSTVTKTAGQDQYFIAAPKSGFAVDKWTLDGTAVQTGGNSYKLSNIQANHAVAVSFRSTAAAGSAMGTLLFNNYIADVIDAKVSRPDGTGAGDGARARLVLVGKDKNISLQPPTEFRTTSAEAAFYVDEVQVSVPGATPGQTVTVRMQAWVGESFDDSKLRGESKDITVTLGGGMQPPANLVGLEGFALEPFTGGDNDDDSDNTPNSGSNPGPLIVEQPNKTKVEAGSTAVFKVKATGTGTLKYQWQHDGSDVVDATSASLEIKNVSSADQGEYLVVVTDDVGSTKSKSAELEIRKKKAHDDFGGDGNSSIMLLGKDRSLAFWLMDGTRIREGKAPYKLPEGWSIVGAGDFNKDGKTDLLLKNVDRSLAVWFMDGTTITKGALAMTLPDGWEIAATGDFNDDGQTDILVQAADGSLAFWLLDGIQVSQTITADFKLPSDWTIIGTGDFDKDGKTDILLRNTTNRSLGFWLMDGTTIKQGLAPMRIPEGWQIIGLGDFNHDGQTDIMLRHDDKWIAFWFMNGTSISAGALGMKEPDGWEIVNHH
jgi:hypothetical protein